jgi:hypothetical protein
MTFKKYRNALILFLIYVIIFIFLSVAYYNPESADPGITTLIPIGGTSAQLVILFLILYPGVAIIGSIIAGYLFTPLFLLVYKSIVGRKMIYGIQETSEITDLKKHFKLFFLH